jgi:hypothetical protein
MYPLKIWMQPLGFCKISKKNMLISPPKNVQQHTYPHVGSVELPCLGTTHFKSCMYIQDILCDVTEHIM